MSKDEQQWSLATGQHNDRPLLIRFRQFPDGFPKQRFPARLNVFWAMFEKNAEGLPSPGETQRMQVFENRLVEAVEINRVAVLAVVLTTDGKQEFVFQACVDSDFMDCLNSMPQETERYPITVQATEDVDWDYVDRVVPTA